MAAEIRIVVNTSQSGAGLKQTADDLREIDGAARQGAGGLGFLATSAATALGGVLVNAAGQALGAVTGFISGSVSAAGDFEAAINGFQAVTGSALGDAGLDFDDVSAKALQLGQDTQFSASEAIAAMTELAKGGVPVVDVMGNATDATLALAAASGESLASSAEIVAKQLGVWGETGVGAQEVTDLIASAANASTVDVADLALGLANAGGTAKVAGVEFGDLVQSMALIAPNFSSASDAGTSFKTFISRLVPTTKPATEAMQALGLYTEETGSVFYDAQGNFVGMEQAAALLKDATAGLSEEQRLQAFNTIFGSDAIRAAAAIAGAGAEGFNAMGESMAASGGAAATAATMQSGFNFALEQAKGSLETMQIVIGTMLLPVLTQLMDGVVTPAINTITQFAQGFAEAGDKGAFLQAKVGELGAFLLNWVTTTLPQWGAGLAQLGEAAWKWIVDATPPAIAQLQAWGAQLLAWVQANAPAWVAQLLAWGESAWKWIQEALPPALAQLAAWGQALLGYLAANLPEWLVQLLAWGKAAVEWIGEAIPPLLAAAGEFLGSLMEWAYGTAIPALVKWGVEAAVGLIAWVQSDLIPKVGPALNDFLTSLGTALGNVALGIGEAAASIGEGIISGIASAISAGASAVAEAAMDAANAALQAAKDFLGIKSPSAVFAAQVGLPAVQGMAQGLVQAAPLAAGAGAYAAGAALGGASGTVNRSFTYAPTITTGSVGVADVATARALARM